MSVGQTLRGRSLTISLSRMPVSLMLGKKTEGGEHDNISGATGTHVQLQQCLQCA